MESFTSYNVRSIILASSGGIFAGYGLSVIANTLGQPTFYETMLLEQDPTKPGYAHTTTITGAINGIFFAGGWIGAVSAGWLARALGRISGFRILCSIGLIGAVLQTGSVDVAMYLVARIIAGFGCGGVLASMPAYYTEIAPPHCRGIMAGAHACSVNFGYMVSGWIGFDISWRFPNALLVFFGLVFWTATFFIPESPRWLVLNDRADKALEIMRRLHHDPSDPDDTFARSELSLIVRQAAADAEAFARDGKWQLFTIPTYRKRIMFGILLIAGTQNVGILVICNYAVSLSKSLGLEADMTLLLSALWMTVGSFAAFVGAYLSDKIGRRRILDRRTTLSAKCNNLTNTVWGFILTVLVFSTATGLIGGYANTGSTKVAAAAVTFIFLYNAIYCSLVDVSAWTLLTEIFPSHLRSVAASLSISMVFLLEVLWLSLAPTATREIGWKYYLVFASLGVAHCVYYWFVLPDTTGLPLEEIDLLFGKEVVGHLADGDIKEEFAANEERVEDLKQTAA